MRTIVSGRIVLIYWSEKNQGEPAPAALDFFTFASSFGKN
jgi:hypothetical protein